MIEIFGSALAVLAGLPALAYWLARRPVTTLLVHRVDRLVYHLMVD